MKQKIKIAFQLMLLAAMTASLGGYATAWASEPSLSIELKPVQHTTGDYWALLTFKDQAGAALGTYAIYQKEMYNVALHWGGQPNFNEDPTFFDLQVSNFDPIQHRIELQAKGQLCYRDKSEGAAPDCAPFDQPAEIQYRYNGSTNEIELFSGKSSAGWIVQKFLGSKKGYEWCPKYQSSCPKASLVPDENRFQYLYDKNRGLVFHFFERPMDAGYFLQVETLDRKILSTSRFEADSSIDYAVGFDPNKSSFELTARHCYVSDSFGGGCIGHVTLRFIANYDYEQSSGIVLSNIKTSNFGQYGWAWDLN